MTKLKSKNDGFTLIELIIAIAVLAFLMTAISSMMGSSVFANKKAQADMTIQSDAQDTYNKITDTIMQAKDVYIFGYTFAGDPDFRASGSAVTGTPALNVYALYDKRTYAKYKLNGEFDAASTIDANKTAIINKLAALGYSVTKADIKFFNDITATDKLYVKKMIIGTAYPIDITKVGTKAAVSADEYDITSAITGEVLKIKTIKNGGVVKGYTEYDHLYNIFTFNESNLYFERRYSFMNTMDDVIVDWTNEQNLKEHLYSDAFSYNTTSGDPLSACVVTVDSEKGSIGFDISFSQKNQFFQSKGIVNVRNSYVLKAKN